MLPWPRSERQKTAPHRSPKPVFYTVHYMQVTTQAKTRGWFRVSQSHQYWHCFLQVSSRQQQQWWNGANSSLKKNVPTFILVCHTFLLNHWKYFCSYENLEFPFKRFMVCFSCSLHEFFKPISFWCFVHGENRYLTKFAKTIHKCYKSCYKFIIQDRKQDLFHRF